RITSIVEVSTGIDGEGAFQGKAIADFSHTETLSHIGVTDRFGNPINNFHITASSGTQYDESGVHLVPANGAIPEPSSMGLGATGALVLSTGCLWRRRRARVIGKRD